MKPPDKRHMNAQGACSPGAGPYRRTPTRPDLIRRALMGAVSTTRLVDDIIYLGTGEGWLYLAVI